MLPFAVRFAIMPLFAGPHRLAGFAAPLLGGTIVGDQ